jgi:hypothetical protein
VDGRVVVVEVVGGVVPVVEALGATVLGSTAVPPEDEVQAAQNSVPRPPARRARRLGSGRADVTPATLRRLAVACPRGGSWSAYFFVRVPLPTIDCLTVGEPV